MVSKLTGSRAKNGDKYAITGGPYARSASIRAPSVTVARRLLSSAVRDRKKSDARHAAEVARINAARGA